MTTPQTVTPLKHRLTDELLYPLYLRRTSDMGHDRYRFAGYGTKDYEPGTDEFVGKPDEWFEGAFSLSDVHGCHILKRGSNCDATTAALTPETLVVGGRYNWKNQPDRLTYLGRSLGGTGGWHQFSKVGDPRPVWCEVLSKDLYMLEETKEVL